MYNLEPNFPYQGAVIKVTWFLMILLLCTQPQLLW